MKFKLAYRKDTCQFCRQDTWCDVRTDYHHKDQPMCRACKAERFFSEILYPPLDLTLLPWQKKVIRDVYGTVQDDGLRQYRQAYISVAKKNGKSFLIGGLPIYHLVMEDERSPEAYGTAASKEQAGIVFKAAAMLAKGNTDIHSRFRILESSKKMVMRNGNGFYAVISADGNLQDGIQPSLLLRDELHRWKTAKAKTLLDVTTKGQLSRTEPLDLTITTAGAEYESPLWFQEYQRAKQDLRNPSLQKTSSLYAAIYEADAKRIATDPEYWKSREARVAANPSHEDLGGFLRDAALRGELDKAINQPVERSAYLRYNLNIPLKLEEDPIIDMMVWEAAPDSGVNLSTWPVFDDELLVKKWNLLEQSCFAGVDASWSTDLTSLVFLFPPFEKTELGPGCSQWTILPYFWVPQNKVAWLERVTNQPIGSWVQMGFINASPGNVIDQREVMNKIRWAQRMFNLVEVAYDRMNFRSEALNLTDDGFTCAEIPQTFLGLSAATKFILEKYQDHHFRHGNNPVYNWHTSCLQVQYDHKDNVQPSKPERLKSKMRIDGMQATITAAARAMVVPAFQPGKLEVW